ncbi:MAG: arylesterase [Balneolaceae bacterium]
MGTIVKKRSVPAVTLFILLSVFLHFPHSGLAGAQPVTVMFFGDSITAGNGLEQEEAYPALIQARADSAGIPLTVINAGVSGETSAGGMRRVDWVFQRAIDIFVLELGGNDGLRGINPDVTKSNLQGIINRVRELSPETDILLTGMEAPPNMGEDYTNRFREIFPELAVENELSFMPFILEGVAGDPDLNQADGIHPTAEGHSVIAENLWEYLQELLPASP